MAKEKENKSRDRALGMDRPITRRDFLNGMAIGGGISGLAAAHFYRAKAPKSRILILDNHDDFDGHAKRNEFNLDGHLNLLNGGTLEIAPASLWSGRGGSLENLRRRRPSAHQEFTKFKILRRPGIASRCVLRSRNLRRRQIGRRPWRGRHRRCTARHLVEPGAAVSAGPQRNRPNRNCQNRLHAGRIVRREETALIAHEL
jgi:hypothetical protein